MNETRETDTSTGEQPKTDLRRPWHPPQFQVTDVASTVSQQNGGHDFSPVAPSLS